MSIPIEKIGPFKYQIPITYQEGMRVPGIFYCDETLLESIRRDESLQQLANAATLPGIVKAALAMPDMHFGYGLPIGGVVATSVKDGVVSPGGVGFDINCGVRIMGTSLFRKDFMNKERLEKAIMALYRHVPAGVGSKSKLKLNSKDQRTLLERGSEWAVSRGYGSQSDLEHTEARGRLDGANPDLVSQRAYDRGKDQQGTLGSGNHFMEIQYVSDIYDLEAARCFGLAQDQITVMIHSGSRGLGHQICTDYLSVMGKAAVKYGIILPDRQLACAPINSPEGQRYLGAMRCAANYAWGNRQCLMHWAEEAICRGLDISPKELGMALIYDVAHNIVKMERHKIDGQEMEVAVHRKGATRAFGPGHPDLPAEYRKTGQPILIPGDMGTCSYILKGTQRAMEETFGSTCHGAGRVLSRNAALKASKGRSIAAELAEKGIIAIAAGRETLREEMPEAYKEISSVVGVVHDAGIALKVARLKPVGVIKG
ncbi:RtcB family protein [bacterium]|nr:RtcB family protein [bacterium]